MILDIRHSIKKKYISTNRTITGSITVEAAFVMPVVILSIFALLYLAFYLHDICIIRGTVDLTIYKAGMTVKHEAMFATGEVAYEKINDRGVFYQLTGDTHEQEEQIQEYLKIRLSKGLFITKIKDIKTEVGKSKISMSVRAATEIVLPGFGHLFKPYSNTMISGECPVHNPAETIRCMEMILETGSRVKGMDQLKKRLEDISGTK